MPVLSTSKYSQEYTDKLFEELHRIMCIKIECPSCKKPTFKGCGNHKEQVLKGIKPEDRCQCKKQ